MRTVAMRAGGWGVAAALLVAGLGVASGVHAHFVLEEPTSWREQDALGNPQKMGPCGNEGTAPETGAITAYREGQTIAVTITETIFHPGHYRVALAVGDRSELPEPPPVMPGTSECGSAPIMDPPVFPVLADGALAHTRPFSGPQTITVTLPEGVTCERCTLQVIQFMTDHAAPCFYYHCADVSIAAVEVDAGAAGDAGFGRADASSPGADAGTAEPSDAGTGGSMDGGAVRPTSGGCGCAAPGQSPASGAFGPAIALLVVALAARRRRRRTASTLNERRTRGPRRSRGRPRRTARAPYRGGRGRRSPAR